MGNSRSEASPIGEQFSLEAVISGLASDLTDLRIGKISVDDARVRAEIAKQIMNGVRLVINTRKILEDRAGLIGKSNGGTRP